MADKEIPYVVAGAGGYADTERALHKIAKDPNTGDKIATPFPTSLPDVTLAAYNDTEPGFLLLKVSRSEIACEYYTTDFQGNPQGVRDHFTVPLAGGSGPAAPGDTAARRRHRGS